MIDFLLGVPGKLKAISDYLSGTLYPYITSRTANLDAAVTSRAPASTALTNATWTNTRAGKLDLVVAESPVAKAPISISPPSGYRHPRALPIGPYGIPGCYVSTLATTSLVDIVNFSGSGVLEVCYATGSNAGSQGLQLVVTIDGVETFNYTLSGDGAAVYPNLIVAGCFSTRDYWDGTATNYSMALAGYSHMPFKSSLRIQGRRLGTTSGYVVHRYWRAT